MEIPVGTYNEGLRGEKHLSLDSFHHTFVDGVSGAGKSTFLEDVAIQNIREGRGIFFLDPHGTSIRRILKYIPRKYSRNVIYFNPLAKKVPGLNFFAFTNKEDRHKAVANLISILKSQAGDAWGAETEHVIQTGGLAVSEQIENPTIVHLYLFIIRQLYRARLIDSSDDQLLKDFQQQFDKDLRTSERMSKFSPPLNKTAPFVQPLIRTIFGQTDSLDLVELMDKNAIILVDLDKGKIGDVNAELIGSAFMSYIQLRAFERKAERRTEFTIFVDEFQNFCHGVNWTTFFAELRKYNIRVWLATQSITQVPEKWLDPILTNSNNIISFAAGSVDAERMMKELGASNITEEDLTYLDDYSFSAKIKFGKSRHFFRNVKVYPPLEKRGDESYWRDVLKTSRMRWGKNRKDEDERIARILRN